MFVAEKLRKNNIGEYLLYMWQIEDLLRAFSLDFDKLQTGYLSQYANLTPEQQAQLEQWYRDLLQMIHREGITERGHLQLCKNVILNLEELHARLYGSSKYPYYHAAYVQILPFIVELRQKNGINAKSELETCFDFLYGVMMLRLQKKALSPETQQALQAVSAFLGMLSDYYRKNQDNPLEF